MCRASGSVGGTRSTGLGRRPGPRPPPDPRNVKAIVYNFDNVVLALIVVLDQVEHVAVDESVGGRHIGR